MKRVIARAAEAEREKEAILTKAKGEVEASKNLAIAASFYCCIFVTREELFDSKRMHIRMHIAVIGTVAKS